MWRLFVLRALRLFEIARVLVRFDHVARERGVPPNLARFGFKRAREQLDQASFHNLDTSIHPIMPPSKSVAFWFLGALHYKPDSIAAQT